MKTDDKITLEISKAAGQLFMNIFFIYHKNAQKKLNELKLRLHEITTSNLPSASEADQVADTILSLSDEIEAAKEINDQLRKYGIYPDEKKGIFLEQLTNDAKKPDNLAKTGLNQKDKM